MNVLSIDVRGVHPLEPQGPSFPRRWPVLRATDGPVYEEYRSYATKRLPPIVARRYWSGPRIARTLTVHFNDEFALGISDSIWRMPYLEILGNDYEWHILSLRLAGETIESINGRHHRIGAYTSYLIRYARGMKYVLRSVSDDPVTEATIVFRPDVLADRLGLSRAELLRHLTPSGDPWYSDCTMTSEMVRALRGLRRQAPDTPGYRLYAEAKALELLSLYIDTVQAKPTSGRPGLPLSSGLSGVQRVKLYIEENYACDLAIDELSAMAGISRKTLTTDFKKAFGRTIREYQTSVRMEVAKTLLRDRRTSILDIAESVGYGYPANFTKAFVKHTGVSPLAYRKGTASD